MSSSSIILKRIIDNSTNVNDIYFLIRCCLKISFSLLAKNFQTETSKFFYSQTTIQDLAIDTITPLFIKDKFGELPIRKALINWDKEIVDDASANYFLYKIISKRIEQELAKKLKEADPFFGKILRSINHLVETNRINKSSWFGVVYILEKDVKEINQKPAESEFIDSIPIKLFIGTNEKIISNLFTYIKTETDFFPAIPLNALIRKIKSVNATFLKHNSVEATNENFEERMNVNAIVDDSLNIIYNRLEMFYLSKEKFNDEEIRVFKLTMQNLANDLKDGGISRGLYDYLNTHMLDLSKEDFYKKYHQTLDYLLRLLKKEIATRINESNN